MNFIIYGIAFMTLAYFLFGMKRMMIFLPDLVKQMGSQRLRRISIALFIASAMVIVVVTVLYFVVWRSDPLPRFAHMIWVLGFWMIGTLGIFLFMSAIRLRYNKFHFILIPSLISILMAIYFTPLPKFLAVFSNPSNLILPITFGVLNVGVSWTLAWYIWNLSPQQRIK